MGVNGLMAFIRKNAPEAITKIDKGEGVFNPPQIQSGSKGIVVIDALLSIYQTYCAGETRGLPSNHLAGSLYRTMNLIEEGYYPVWVFDGKPPELKKETIEARLDKPEMKEKIIEVRKLFDIIGIQYVDAASEAEAQCVEFAKNIDNVIVVTNDSDVIMMGAPITRTWNNEIIDMKILLSAFEMTQDELTDFCILIGTDYNKRVLGPVTAWGAIKEHKTLEASIRLMTKKLSDDQVKRVLDAAKEIRKPDVIPAAMLKITRQTPKKRSEVIPQLIELGIGAGRTTTITNKLLMLGWLAE